MGFIRFIIQLPFQIICLILKATGWILKPLFGQWTWTPPFWITLCKKHTKTNTYGLLGLFIIILGSGYGIYWYKHRPQPIIPNLVKFYYAAPQATIFPDDPNEHPIIHPLKINFSGSAAPLNQLGKDMANTFPISPNIKGIWRWESDHSLEFQPGKDWAIGQKYTVDFSNKALFNPHIVLRSAYELSNRYPTVRFETTPFQGKIINTNFYEDPKDPTIKKGAFELQFNYPVDPVSLEKNIELRLYKSKRAGANYETISYDVSYDKTKLHASIISKNLSIPTDDGKLTLIINQNVKSALGSNILEKKLSDSLSVPGLYTFQAEKIEANTITNPNGTSDHVLQITFNRPVEDGVLSHNISAWILPNDSSLNRNKQIDTNYLSHCQSLPLELIPSEESVQNAQTFKFKAIPQSKIYILIAAGLKSSGGYITPKPYGEKITVPDYPKHLNFLSDGALLSLNSDKHISVFSQNIPGIRLIIGQLRPQQLQHLVSFSDPNASFSKPNFIDPFNEDHILQRYEQTLSFNDRKTEQKPHYSGFDLSAYLKPERHGIFIVHLTEYDAQNEKKEKDRIIERKLKDEKKRYAIGNTPIYEENKELPPIQDTRLIVITDMGILVKKNLDETQDVFIQSISTGKPIIDANVTVMSMNGEKLLSQTSDADGMVHFPSLTDFKKEKEPVMYVATKNDDLSFLPIKGKGRELDFSRFDIGGDSNTSHKNELQAYLFSDRGIYRPGDTVHIGMIVKAVDWQQNAAGLPLSVDIFSPAGKHYEYPFKLDKSGFGEITAPLDENAPNGRWSVDLNIPGNEKDEGYTGLQTIGHTTIQVKEFLPEQTRVQTHFTEQSTLGWVKPDQLKAIVEARNLFGTPAADRRVEASIRLLPFVPNFSNWKDYQFSNSNNIQNSFEQTLQDLNTDQNGQATFNLNLEKYASSSYALYFLAKVYEPDSGRNVSDSNHIIVSSNDWMIGYKSIDDLSNIKLDAKPNPIRFIAINPQSQSIEVKGLKLRLLERRYVSVLVKQYSGLYKYESKERETILKDEPFTINKDGTDYTIDSHKAGDFSLIVLSDDNKELNRINYSILGEQNLSRSLDRNAELKIQLDKKSYKPGESIEVAIRAPYTGSGIITIERDKVYAHTWFHTDTTSTIQHITVPDNLEGNGYVNVQFIRDPSSNEIFTSPLSYGLSPFAIDLENRRNNLQLEAPEMSKSGQTIHFTLKSAHPTQAVIWAVDQGILQVANYKFTDPLDFFFSKKSLDVKTFQILDQILPEFSKMMLSYAASGGDAEKDRLLYAAQVNPFKRKNEKPVVYWSGIINVDQETQVTYTPPESYNGTLKVMALSVSDDQIGHASQEMIIRDDFTLKPNAPTTLAPGDESEVSLLVSNNLLHLDGAQIPITVTLKTSPQFQIIGDHQKTLSLGELKQGVVKFHIKALKGPLGSGNLFFEAGYKQSSVKNTMSILLRPASPYQTQITIGHVKKSDTISFSDFRNLYQESATRYANLSNLPTVISQGLNIYLLDYPHLCTEQLLSKALPLLMIEKNPDLKKSFYQTRIASNSTVEQTLTSIINIIHDRQNNQGGFGLWNAAPVADDLLTVYATLFMQEATEHGIVLPDDMMQKALNYLKDYAVSGSNDSLPILRNKAFAIYMLTRQGQVTSNIIATLSEHLNTQYKGKWEQDATAAWLAASYKLLKQDEIADNMIKKPLSYLRKENTSSSEDNLYDADSFFNNNLDQDASIFFIVSRHFPALLPQLSGKAIDNITTAIEENDYNTFSASMILLALNAYSNQMTSETNKLSIVLEKGKNQPVITSTQNGNQQQINWTEIPSALQFKNSSNYKAWYTIIQKGYDQNVPNTAISKKLEILREYTDKNGKPIEQIKVGQMVYVHIKIRSTDGKNHSNIAITDLLPGGFDAVTNNARPDDNDEPDSKTTKWQPDFVNIQEDKAMIYGTIDSNIGEYIYRIKATNIGKYIIPPAYGEGMYDQTIRARSASGGYLTINAP